jgi:WD40 repeat protein
MTSTPPSPQALPQPPSLTVDPPLAAASESTTTTFTDQDDDRKDVEKQLDLEVTYTLVSHYEKPACVKFSPDGKYIAVGCSHGETHIFDGGSGTLIWSVTF